MTDGSRTWTSTTLCVDITRFDDEQRRILATRVDALIVELLAPTGPPTPVAGWTASALREALARLDRENGSAQAKVIREGLAAGGRVSRERVFELNGFGPDRMLRGFTRPVQRVMRHMRAAGLIGEDAVNLLQAGYSSGVSADHFVVPAELGALLMREEGATGLR